MQKFVRMKSTASIPEEQAALHPSQVKLVGYLKKKRTKVGGWRKMWFVLQNQLLLSYSSKEDYDKKLVSFKDVLNLVPGTIVRPLGGYRFAIQTTSESVYIFRCDDNKNYMEWITALVESLSINSSGGKKKDGFGGIIPKKPLHASHSCSSLIRSKKNKASVHMPIAHGTARILNRTGLSENDLRAFSSSGCSQYDATQRANYFCLHENQFQLQNQSNAVSRINRMFCGSVSDVEVSSTINPTTSDMGLVQQATTLPTMTTTMTTTTTSTMAMTTPMTTAVKSTGITGLESESDGDVLRKSVLNNKMHQLLSYMTTDNLNINLDKVQLMPECEFPRDINSNRSFNYENLLGLESAYFGETLKLKPADIADGNATIEDRIQRLSLRGSSGFVVNDSRNILNDQEANFLRLSTTIRTEEGSPFLRQRRRNDQGCASVSSAGSCSSSAKKNETSCNGDETEVSEEVGRNFQNEPIYAVVDLKNKYEHRARIRHEMEERRKSHGGYMKSLDEVSTDYEEVLNFQEESSNDYKETESSGYDEENIYEPINIPESSYGNDKHRNGLWKYISRINIDALIEMARNRKKNSKSSEHTSPFANIRQKIGHHRKSIRIRMNKFYTREQPTEEIIEHTEASDKELDQI